MSLDVATEVLSANTPGTNPIPFTGATAALPANTERNGGSVSADNANPNPVYVLFGPGTPSATNWHLCLPAGATRSLVVGSVVWLGAVSMYSAGASKVGVAET